tara:strand:+ start:1201 stop:1353 length:153 start_codon:yes stop_codon:yes gene_type:complete
MILDHRGISKGSEGSHNMLGFKLWFSTGVKALDSGESGGNSGGGRTGKTT